MPRTYTRRPVIDRVMDKVEKRDGHWIWTGSVGSSGYGKIAGDVHVPDERPGDLLVHRTTYEYYKGPIAYGFVLDHIEECLTILCCNPDHLEPVTQRENRLRQSERRKACNRGHAYTPENTREGANGRECRACAAEREAQRRARNRRPDYEERCGRGHERTYENTARQGNGLRCRTCTSEAAQARRHREAAERESGSTTPPS